MGDAARSSSHLLTAIRTAGPSRRDLLLGGLVAGSIMVLLAFGLQIWNPLVAVAVPVVVFTVVGLRDRDAFVARAAIYQFGELQAARLSSDFPSDEATTEAWLADPAPRDPISRADVLFKGGAPDKALEAIQAADLSDPSDAVAAERLRLTIERARGSAQVDQQRFYELSALLSPADRRWHRLSLAVMQLDADVAEGVPWRERFVRAVRELGPWHLPKRAWFVVVTQQFVMAITFAFLFILVAWIALR
jgi:hypothetical protein